MVLRCDCGFRVAAEHEGDLVAGAAAHAREAHGTDVDPEMVLGLLRSSPNPGTIEVEGKSP
jgi:predicted small metal-binding protein